MSKAIVIGTGAGGLAAAIGLAQQGHEVIALEAAKQLGGFLNPFARKPFHFAPGVHYMGQLGPGETTTIALEKMGLDAAELFCPMDPKGCDVLAFPEITVRMPIGLPAYRATLKGHFPSEKREIDKFFGVLTRFSRTANAAQQLPMRKKKLSDFGALGGVRFATKWMERTFGEVLDHFISHPTLRGVLSAQCGDYGLPPSRTPAFLGLGVLLHYITGGYFPRGGSGAFRDALVNRGKSLGATYRRRAPVTEIHLDAGRISGVSLANGERLEADIVVSAIDPALTFGKLLPANTLSPRLSAKVENTTSSLGSLCVFLGVKRDLSKFGLGNFNVWDYPNLDIEGQYAHLMDGNMPKDWGFFLSPNSLKDDSNSMAPAGCSTLEVVSLVPFKPFEKWADTAAFKRGPEYEAYKNEIADSLLGDVEKRWPGLVGDVVVKDVATPLTNSHFANTVRGGAYGPAAIPEQYGRHAWRPKAPIDGLFLAGSGVFGAGVAPCLMSGLAAAAAVEKAQTAG